MFADLCVPSEVQHEAVPAAFKLGYDCVAVSSRVVGRLTQNDRCSITPLDGSALATGVRGMEQTLRVNSRFSWTNRQQDSLQQLTRLTFVAEDHIQTQALEVSKDVVSSYDIVALQPLTERGFKQACTVLEVDIISIDLGMRLPFKLRPPVVKAAVARGVVFEICYSSALRDGATRWNLFANAQALTRATSGRSIIVSSNARAAFEMRGPYDVVNMASLMGLKQQQAKEAISSNCRSVLLHAEARKRHKSGVNVLPPEEVSEPGEQETPLEGS
mmetsp:Transcript_19647/g.54586  ORF Transcript_19647/g.54586 Transcript_19647/m.54586 type:complete len:273 (-) Transcript_19647:148-966(-)